MLSELWSFHEPVYVMQKIMVGGAQVTMVLLEHQTAKMLVAKVNTVSLVFLFSSNVGDRTLFRTNLLYTYEKEMNA